MEMPELRHLASPAPEGRKGGPSPQKNPSQPDCRCAILTLHVTIPPKRESIVRHGAFRQQCAVFKSLGQPCPRG